LTSRPAAPSKRLEFEHSPQLLGFFSASHGCSALVLDCKMCLQDFN
jgi:hypothetical protein